MNGSTDNKGAPMACAMIYWGDNFPAFEAVFNEFGAVVSLGALKKARTNSSGTEEMLLFDFSSREMRRSAVG